MRILLIGNGAREHAIVKALDRSTQDKELYAFMTAKNPGITRIVSDYIIGDTCNPGEVAEYADKKSIELAVIGPEAPLNVGVVDVLEDKGISCSGPRKIAAQLETDKTFCRNLLEKYKIKGNPSYGVFSEYEKAAEYIDSIDHEYVIKPAGLTGGKGVKVSGEHLKDKEEAKAYIREILNAKVGHLAQVVVEEKLVGEEFTLQGFVDGKRVIGTPTVQDHKRAYEGDTGPNTGGMGSYSNNERMLPFITKEDYEQGLKIMEDTINAVKKETGTAYKGFLYGQFMATKDDIGVIEFNARLGDPEAMNILPILESDFVDICHGMATGTLEREAKFSNKATVCKYMVPEGYPEKPKKDLELEVDENSINKLGGEVYYASVREENGKILSSKSRAIAVTGIADSISEAEKVGENSMQYIKGELFHRKDIGTDVLIQKRIDHMKKLRG